MVLIKHFHEGIFWFDAILEAKGQGMLFVGQSQSAKWMTRMTLTGLVWLNIIWSRKRNITIHQFDPPKWRIFKVLKCPMFLKSSFCYSDHPKTPPTGSTVLEALFIVEPPFYSGSRAPPVQRSNLQLISFLCPRLKVDFVKGRFMALDATDVIGCSPQTFLEKRIRKDFLTRRWLFGWELSWIFRDILDSTSMFHLQVGWTRGTSRACWQHLWQLLGFWRHRGTNCWWTKSS